MNVAVKPGFELVMKRELAAPRERVFEFFAAAENLEAITPRELGFEILTPRPIVLARGARIDYRLRLFGVPLRWGTLISEGTKNMQSAPWLLIFPAIFFVITLFALNFVGDGLRDALDPKDR